jgi:hypothetical protein
MLKKGSKEAKAFMAKIRAAKGKKKSAPKKSVNKYIGINNKYIGYDIFFDNDENTNNKGFDISLIDAKSYIKQWNGTGYSYFRDYVGGTVSIFDNRTEKFVYETEVKPIKPNK